MGRWLATPLGAEPIRARWEPAVRWAAIEGTNCWGGARSTASPADAGLGLLSAAVCGIFCFLLHSLLFSLKDVYMDCITLSSSCCCEMLAVPIRRFVGLILWDTLYIASVAGLTRLANCLCGDVPSEMRCHVLHLIPRGRYTCTHGFEVDSRCDFTCDTGYRIEGEHSRTCQHRGAWSGAQPVCTGTYPGLSPCCWRFSCVFLHQQMQHFPPTSIFQVSGSFKIPN